MLAFSGPVFRIFAPPSPVSPAHSPLAARGYGPAYFRASPSKLPGPSRHLASLTAARCSGAADALWACSTIRYGRSASLASSLAALPTSLGLLRAASPTGRALRAPLAPPAASRPSTAHFVCSPLQPFGPPMFASSLAAFLALLGSSYRPALRWPGIPGLRSASRCSSIQHGRTTALASSLAALPASLGLLRPVSRTARGLRAPLAPPPLRGFDDYGLFRALRAAFVRPFSLREKGGFWAVLLHTVAPLSKRLPLIPRGAGGEAD